MRTMEKKKATLEDRRLIYEGRIFKVEVDRVQLPTGHTVSMDLVRHPGSVVMLAMPSPDQIILIRQYRYTLDRWIWELPAGSLEPGEDPAAGAARECEEEIGLVPGRVEKLRAYYPTPGFCDEVMTYFRCTDLRQPDPDSQAQQDEDEELEPRTFTIAELRAMVDAGEIVDLKTAVALLLI
jgi:ADP-ribose pyrophosphatase